MSDDVVLGTSTTDAKKGRSTRYARCIRSAYGRACVGVSSKSPSRSTIVDGRCVGGGFGWARRVGSGGAGLSSNASGMPSIGRHASRSQRCFQSRSSRTRAWSDLDACSTWGSEVSGTWSRIRSTTAGGTFPVASSSSSAWKSGTGSLVSGSARVGPSGVQRSIAVPLHAASKFSQPRRTVVRSGRVLSPRRGWLCARVGCAPA